MASERKKKSFFFWGGGECNHRALDHFTNTAHQTKFDETNCGSIHKRKAALTTHAVLSIENLKASICDGPQIS